MSVANTYQSTGIWLISQKQAKPQPYNMYYSDSDIFSVEFVLDTVHEDTIETPRTNWSAIWNETSACPRKTYHNASPVQKCSPVLVHYSCWNYFISSFCEPSTGFILSSPARSWRWGSNKFSRKWLRTWMIKHSRKADSSESLRHLGEPGLLPIHLSQCRTRINRGMGSAKGRVSSFS